MRTSSRPRPWATLLELFPGTFVELVAALGTNRSTAWDLRTGRHRKTPHDLLRRLADLLAQGTADGSAPPTAQELTAAWLKAFRR